MKPGAFKSFSFSSSSSILVIGTVLLLSASAPSQSLWHDTVSRSMFADKRAVQVGDILTVVVQESSTASKNNQTTTAKQSALDAALTKFFYSPGASGLLTKGGQLPELAFNSKSTFAGGGTINNTEAMTSQAAVRVVDVLPNGNLVIEGKRESAFGGEHTTQILRGVVRPEDVRSDDTVLSFKIADATIQFATKGAITESQHKGWFHRLWDKFAPF